MDYDYFPSSPPSVTSLYAWTSDEEQNLQQPKHRQSVTPIQLIIIRTICHVSQSPIHMYKIPADFASAMEQNINIIAQSNSFLFVNNIMESWTVANDFGNTKNVC